MDLKPGDLFLTASPGLVSSLIIVMLIASGVDNNLWCAYGLIIEPGPNISYINSCHATV